MTSIEDLEKKINGVVTDMKTRDAIVFNDRKHNEDVDYEAKSILPLICWCFVIIITIAIGFFLGAGITISHEKSILAANNATVLITWIAG